MPDACDGLRVTDRADELRASFLSALPVPHVVIDGFLAEDLARGVLEEFPPLASMQRSGDYIFGDKRVLTDLASRGPASRQLADLFLSPRFARFLGVVSGCDGLFIDPGFHGGGFHRGGRGSYLDMHVDFSVHPHHADWLRELNVLLYLCDDWRDQYGGELQLRHGTEGPVVGVLPAFNRAVVMATSASSYHGYRALTVPDGVDRLSVAAYAYSHCDPAVVEQRTTTWDPEDAGLARRLVARNWNAMNRVKRRLTRVDRKT